MDVMIRKCTHCGLEAWTEDDLQLFTLSYASNYNRMNRCKECSSKYQISRREKHQAVADAAKDVPCVDCGGRFPPVSMDFDHLGNETKVGTISGLIRKSVALEILEAEIAKCEVVCANCHRVRTWASDRKYPNTGAAGK